MHRLHCCFTFFPQFHSQLASRLIPLFISFTALWRTTRVRTILSQFCPVVGADHDQPDDPQAHWWKMPGLSSERSQGRPRTPAAAGPQGTPDQRAATVRLPQDLLPTDVGTVARGFRGRRDRRGRRGRCHARNSQGRGRGSRHGNCLQQQHLSRRSNNNNVDENRPTNWRRNKRCQSLPPHRGFQQQHRRRGCWQSSYNSIDRNRKQMRHYERPQHQAEPQQKAQGERYYNEHKHLQ